MRNYYYFRQNLAEKIRQVPKSQRKELLESSRDLPEYYVSFYSKKENNQLTSDEVLDYLVRKSYDTKVLEETLIPGSLIHESYELIKIEYLFEDFKRYRESKFVTVDLKESIKKRYLYLNESLQKYNSLYYSLLKTYFQARARRVLSHQKIAELESSKTRNYSELSRYRGILFFAQNEETNLSFSLSQLKKLKKEILLLLKKTEEFDFIPRFTGTSLMDRVEFEDIPDSFISVYHFTDIEAINSIDNLGLVTTKQPSASRINQVYLDRYKSALNPRYQDRIDEISRSNSLYAFLNPDEAYNFFDISPIEQIMLEVKVDPKNCFVVSFDESTKYLEQASLRNSFNFSYSGGSFRDSFDFKEYWKNVVSYEDFLAFYDSNGHLKPNSPAGMPDFIESPEIIITTDIPQKHIKRHQEK